MFHVRDLASPSYVSPSSAKTKSKNSSFITSTITAFMPAGFWFICAAHSVSIVSSSVSRLRSVIFLK